MKPLKIGVLILLPVLTGMVTYGVTSRHYEKRIQQSRTAYGLSMQLAPVQMAAMTMSQTGCSNFFYLVVGEKGGIQTAGVIRSNSVAFGVNITEATNSSESSRHRL